MADVGSLVVKVTANSQDLTRGLEAAYGKVKSIGGKVGSAFGGIGSTLAKPFRSAGSALSSLGKLDVFGPLAAGAAGAAAGAATLAAAYASGSSKILETAEAARMAGVSLSDWQTAVEFANGSAEGAAAAIGNLRSAIDLSGTALAKTSKPLEGLAGSLDSIDASGVRDATSAISELSAATVAVKPLEFPEVKLPEISFPEVKPPTVAIPALRLPPLDSLGAIDARPITQTATALSEVADAAKTIRTPAAQATDALGRLGLSGRDLAGLPLTDSLGKIADKFAALKSPADQARIAYEIFGDGARDLIPSLLEGSAGLDSAAARVKGFGLAVSESDVANAKAAADALESLTKLKDGVVNQLAVGIAPVIAEVGELFSGVGLSVDGLADTVISGMQGIGYAVAAGVESWKGLTMVWDGLKIAFQKVVSYLLDGLALVGDGINAASEKVRELSGIDLGTIDLSGVRDSARAWSDAADTNAADFWKKWAEDKSAFTTVNDLFDRIRNRMKETHEDAKKRNVIDAMLADTGAIGKLKDSLRTPFDDFKSQAKEVMALQARGAFRLAPGLDLQVLGAEFRKLQQSFQLPEVKFAGAAEKGSKEAYSAILKFQNPQKAESVQDAMKRIQEQLLREQKENVRVGKDVLKVLKKNPPLTVRGI